MVANGAPILARNALGNRFARPVDGGRRLADGYPIFGHSKTLRGLIASLVATAAAAPVVGYGLEIGLAVAALTMAGDLLSSFVKRRRGLPSSAMAVGIDQVPESLLPAIVMRGVFDLDWGEVIALTALFFVLELVVSAVLYVFGIRENPY